MQDKRKLEGREEEYEYKHRRKRIGMKDEHMHRRKQEKEEKRTTITEGLGWQETAWEMPKQSHHPNTYRYSYISLAVCRLRQLNSLSQ